MGWGTVETRDERKTDSAIVHKKGYEPGSSCPGCHKGILNRPGAMETGEVFCPKCGVKFNSVEGTIV